MQGFGQWGDKLLAFITGICALAVTQAQSLGINEHLVAWITLASAVATLAHTIWFPNLTPPASSSGKQSGRVTPSFLAFLLLALLAACLFSGCSTLGLAPAQNPQQGIAYAYSTVSGSLNTLAQVTNAGLVSSGDAIKVNEAILAVKHQLDTANSVVGTNPNQAAGILTAATAALTQVSVYLTCRQQKGASCPLP